MDDDTSLGHSTLRDSFDPIYFSDQSWSERVAEWIESTSSLEFSRGNSEVVRQAISDDDSGLRVFVNIGTHALLQLLPAGRYLNLYERPVIGGERQQPSPQREEVDTALGLVGDEVYFAALGLGGVGVRYYGEFCLVLRLDDIDPDPQLFDRDSYDILLEPIAGLANRSVLVRRLTGRWSSDRYAMVEMKVLPEIVHQRRLVTSGTVSEVVLRDQEFIEVHLHPEGQREAGLVGGFGPSDLEEMRESPDEVSMATRLREREQDGLRLTDVEFEWLLRRECVSRVVSKAGITSRVVTQHGRGYQWK